MDQLVGHGDGVAALQLHRLPYRATRLLSLTTSVQSSS